ncbi:hypothetical protein RKD18_003005 [Streptomyces phaeoluteigriseus]
MRRTAARLLTGTALAVVTAAGFAAPAQAAVSRSGGGLDVYPATAVPGGQVTVKHGGVRRSRGGGGRRERGRRRSLHARAEQPRR